MMFLSMSVTGGGGAFLEAIPQKVACGAKCNELDRNANYNPYRKR
jgi:hypothetical protein